MSITESDVRHVASLARVRLDAERIPLLVVELNGILRHMDALQRIALPADSQHDVAPAMTLADDVVGGVALERSREDMAPTTRDGFFLVPRLATHVATDGDPVIRGAASEAP